jgi:predicted enzyme related to lactoylglutathione lyase
VAIVLVFEITFGITGVNMTEKDRRIDYIELPTVDLIEAKRFYGEVFGWKFVDYGPEYTSFNDGRLDGGFRKEATVQRGGPLIIIYSINLELIKDKVKSAGGTIVKDIFEFPGGRRFHFTDPSGNELAVWSDK